MNRFFIFTLLVFCVTGCYDVVSKKYNTMEDAYDDDLFKKGWLPEILPESTTNIKTNNDLDNNISTGSFYIPRSEMNQFISKLKKEDGAKPSSYYYNNQTTKWVFICETNNNYVKYELVKYVSPGMKGKFE